MDKLEKKTKVSAKIRYSAKEAEATIEEVDGKIKVVFDEMQKAITPGQSVVFYIGDIVLGGEKLLNKICT